MSNIMNGDVDNDQQQLFWFIQIARTEYGRIEIIAIKK